MDVYSFGIIMWELFHECVPFDGKLKECSKLILEEDFRPKILLQIEDDLASPELLLEQNTTAVEKERQCCTPPIANLISKCWVSDPNERPDFNLIIEELTKEIGFFKTATP